MKDAYLIGAGQTDFGAFPDESYRSLFRTVFEDAAASVPNPCSVVRRDSRCELPSRLLVSSDTASHT